MLALPYVIALPIGGREMARKVSEGFINVFFPLLAIYFLNFFLLIPRYLFGKDKKWFYVINAAIIIGLLTVKMVRAFSGRADFRPEVSVPALVLSFTITSLVSDLVVIMLAVGIRYMLRWNEMQIKLKEEEKRKKEAELTWLTYQLNPHFLFNTMNNISSLTQIDPDQAQESIGRLSDILRYALYETDKRTVPLAGEIDFMKDYIDLMKLRCNSMTQVSVNLRCPEGNVTVAPLLYISLIENAFKHGINARQESFVNIYLGAEGKDLVFECANSLFEKAANDEIGSGIGLENLKQRLELLYEGKYSFEQEIKDGTYSVRLVLKDLIDG